MFDSDQACLAWFNENIEAARNRAAEIFRRYIEMQRALKNEGSNQWVNSWYWKDAISEVLDRPLNSDLVVSASDLLHVKAKPWKLERYDDKEMFERLIDQFVATVDEASGGLR